MRLEQDRLGQFKNYIYIGSAAVLFLTWCLSLGALTQEGGVDGRLAWVFGLVSSQASNTRKCGWPFLSASWQFLLSSTSHSHPSGRGLPDSRTLTPTALSTVYSRSSGSQLGSALHPTFFQEKAKEQTERRLDVTISYTAMLRSARFLRLILSSAWSWCCVSLGLDISASRCWWNSRGPVLRQILRI